MRAGQMPSHQSSTDSLLGRESPRTDCRYAVHRCHESPIAGNKTLRLRQHGSLRWSFLQGPPAQRFVYIDVGTYAGQAVSCWSRRMKVSLDDIPASFIRTGGVLVTRVPETEWDGSPNCSTGKDFQGWNPAEPT